MESGAQRRHRRIAAHESDQGPFDMVEAQPAGDDLVDARRDEAGAARHHQMGDSIERRLLGEPGDRRQRQLRRLFRIAGHPRRGRRRRAVIEAARLVVRPPARRRRQHRPAMLDARPVRHPHEQLPQARIPDPPLRPVDEQPVDVVGGDRSGDRIDEGASFAHGKHLSRPCFGSITAWPRLGSLAMGRGQSLSHADSRDGAATTEKVTVPFCRAEWGQSLCRRRAGMASAGA